MSILDYIGLAFLFIIMLPFVAPLLGQALQWWVDWAELLWDMLPKWKRRQKDDDGDDHYGYQGRWSHGKTVDPDPNNDREYPGKARPPTKEEMEACDRWNAAHPPLGEKPTCVQPEPEVFPKVGEYWLDRSGTVHGPLVENKDLFYNRAEDNPRSLMCGDFTWRNNGRFTGNHKESMFDLRQMTAAPVPAPADESRGDAPADPILPPDLQNLSRE